MKSGASSATAGKVRAADAKEGGVGNPAEETYCHPNNPNSMSPTVFVNTPQANVNNTGTFDFSMKEKGKTCCVLRVA